MEDKEIIIVAAVAENGVIGRDGSIPWDYPEDSEHYHSLKKDVTVISGRRTFNGVDDAEPSCEHIVLTTTIDHYDSPNVHAATDIELALSIASTLDNSRILILGGENVYRDFLPIADKMILSEIPESPSGDTYFPKWDASRWNLVNEDKRDTFTIKTYTQA